MQLPTPDPEAFTHSKNLQHLIVSEIENQQGWISFARYMELALYAPGLGYYSAGTRKLGRAGDFITAPEISSLFGRTLARQAKQIIQLTNGNILEIGAGTGKLALDLLSELATVECLPHIYYILEVSGDLRARQQSLLKQNLPQLFNRIVWIDVLPEKFSGLIFGNEVLDAMPVHILAWRDGKVFERGVSLENKKFSWKEQPLRNKNLIEIAQRVGASANYISEINLAARGFIATLASILERGVILMIDYGFTAKEYYHPQRNQGTLMCHYRHQVHDDPFYLPGLQDITTHIDFSAIADIGEKNKLTCLGYTNQAQFLINCGITEVLGEVSPEDAANYLPLANQAQKLLSPAEMGELFKVIAMGGDISAPLLGFLNGNKMRSLNEPNL